MRNFGGCALITYNSLLENENIEDAVDTFTENFH